MTRFNPYKLLFIFLLFFLNLNDSFAGRLMVETGMHQDFININGQKYSTFTLPSIGISIAGTKDGLSPRIKVNTAYRNFHITSNQDAASTLKTFFGLEYQFPSFSGITPYLFTGLQYRYSEEKYYLGYYSGFSLYDYYKYKTISIPFVSGFYYDLSNYFLISLEIEADFISLYSSFKPDQDNPANSYRESNFALYISAGIKF